jgi:hypothetical protein
MSHSRLVVPSTVECRFVGACGGDMSIGLVGDSELELQPTSVAASEPTTSAARR